MPPARKKPRSPMPKRECKIQRLELRLAPSAKKAIEQAISVAGDLAYAGTPLDKHERMILLGADRDAFLAAIGRKPDPSAGLVDALRRHHDFFG